MDLSALGDLGKLAEQMQDAYTDGMDSMNQAGQETAQNMNYDHEIEIDFKLSAKVEGHDYKVEAIITFDIELEPIFESMNTQTGELSSILDNLNINLGNDKEAIMEQLGQPRAIGTVKKIDLKKLELSNDKGKVETELNRKGTLLATIKDGKILINFESVLSYPQHTDVFIAIPSMEEMQKNIVIDLQKPDSKVSFNWTEKDKDNLKVSGQIKLSKI